MSMISGQIDRLRTAAQTYRRLGNHSAESMLLDAADTIWELRDDLQRANADNAKLRELVEDMHAALQAFCDAQDVHGDNCPLWVERTDDCELRGIERRMRELGVDE